VALQHRGAAAFSSPPALEVPRNANMCSPVRRAHPTRRFRRAIEARNLTRAITEARELPQISLADAAELVVLAADDHGPSFDRWAGRWAARYVLEERNVTLGEAQLVLAGLARLREAGRQSAALALVAIFAARNRPDLDRPFRRLLRAKFYARSFGKAQRQEARRRCSSTVSAPCADISGRLTRAGPPGSNRKPRLCGAFV
jgi:hypothetical protein